MALTSDISKWQPNFDSSSLMSEYSGIASSLNVSQQTSEMIILYSCRWTIQWGHTTHLFFSSSSLLISHLNFCRSCCRSSLTSSRSFTWAPCPKRFTKWNVDEDPSWRQTWSWIFGFPSGDIFCAETNDYYQQKISGPEVWITSYRIFYFCRSTSMVLYFSVSVQTQF